MSYNSDVGDIRLLFWKRVFPIFLVGVVLHEIGIPVFHWFFLGIALILFLLAVLFVKALVFGLKYGPTILSVADFVGVDLPEEYYDFKPLIRAAGKLSDGPLWIENGIEWLKR